MTLPKEKKIKGVLGTFFLLFFFLQSKKKNEIASSSLPSILSASL